MGEGLLVLETVLPRGSWSGCWRSTSARPFHGQPFKKKPVPRSDSSFSFGPYLLRCSESEGLGWPLFASRPRAVGLHPDCSPQRDTVQIALYRLASERVDFRPGAKRHIVGIYPPRSRQFSDLRF